MQRLPATVELTFAALLIAVAIAVPAGIISAVKRGSAIDRLAMVGAVAGRRCRFLARGAPAHRLLRRAPAVVPRLRHRHAGAPRAAGGELVDHHPRPAGSARALEHARGAGPGLCAHGAGQGPRRAAGPRARTRSKTPPFPS